MKTIYSFLITIIASLASLNVSAQISNYCSSNATSTLDTKIDSVILNTIQAGSNPATCETYTNNTSMSTTLSPGMTYSIDVKHGSCGGYYGGEVGAWIDFDQSGTFDVSERIITATYSASGQVATASFTVPPTASSGPTFMRVMLNESTFGGAFPCGTYSYGETEDYSILIKSTTPNDAGATAIIEPSASCEGTYDAKAEIRNFGINQIISVLVEWTVDGIPMTPLNHTTLLDTIGGVGSSSAIVNLGTVALVGGTPLDIKVWTSVPNSVTDPNPLNDSVAQSYNPRPLINSFPYYEDYESGRGDWVIAGVNSTWEFGTPAGSNIVGAASGDSAFVTSISGNYNANEQSNVSSPCFDLTGFSGVPWVGVDINYDTENGWDGAVLQASSDDGKTWQTVGNFGDPHNWYTDDVINGSPGGQDQGWENASNGWIKAAHGLDASLETSGVILRIAFGSDGSFQEEGFAFDNFAIVDYMEPEFGYDKQSLCGSATATLDPNLNFNGTIAWSTGDSISQTIQVSTEDTYWVSYTDSMLGITASDTVVIIQSPAPVISFASLIDTIALDGNTTLDPNTPYDLNYDWQPGGLGFPYLLVKGSDLGVGTHPFTLTVTDSVACSDVKIVTVVVVDFTGIDDYENASMTYYPNPVEDVLTLQLNGFDDSSLNLEVIDLQGKVMLSESLLHQNNRTYTLNLSTLPSGMYMLSVRGETKSALTRIIVK